MCESMAQLSSLNICPQSMDHVSNLKDIQVVQWDMNNEEILRIVKQCLNCRVEKVTLGCGGTWGIMIPLLESMKTSETLQYVIIKLVLDNQVLEQFMMDKADNYGNSALLALHRQHDIYMQKLKCLDRGHYLPIDYDDLAEKVYCYRVPPPSYDDPVVNEQMEDREYVGLYNWRSIMKFDSQKYVHRGLENSKIFIDALQDDIGMDQDIQIMNMISSYPACVLSRDTVNDFSAFAVCAQREDGLVNVTNLNMIFHVLTLAPNELTHMVHLCNCREADSDNDIAIGTSSHAQSPILNRDGESSVSTISQVSPRTHQFIKTGYYGPLKD